MEDNFYSGYRKKVTNTNFDEVERLRLVLLSQGDGTQHSVDVPEAPHRGAQQGRSGADAGSQDVEQVPNTTLVELREERWS